MSEFTNKAFLDMFSTNPGVVKRATRRWTAPTKRRPGRARDSQRKRVYASDGATKPHDRADVTTVDGLERYIVKVWMSKRVQDAFPKAVRDHAMPAVKDGRGRRRAGGNAHLITMPLWSRREGIVLHELAHTITQRTHGQQVAAHGREYCAIYLKLVLYMMGREAHDALKAAFKAHRVRFTVLPAKRVLTDEQRAVLVARLESARRAKQAAVAA